MELIKSRSLFAMLICYIVGVAVYSFDPLMQSFPSILTDDFMKTFSITSVGVGFIASSYFYSYNLMQIPAGILCDKLGIKFIVTISSIICIAALTIFSVAESLSAAILARILMGLGASCAAVVLILVCKEYFSLRLLPILIGVGQLVCNIGALSGQYPLTYIAAKLGWRSSVFSLSIFPIFIMIAGLIFFDNKAKNRSSKSYRAYFSEIKEVFSNKNNWHISLYAMLLWTPFYTFSSLWGIPFLKEKLNISLSDASMLVAISWIGSGVGSILIGMWSSYLQKRRICIIASAIIGIIIFPFLIAMNIHNMMFLYTILFIFGLASSGQALSFVLIDDHNKPSVLGTASGFNNTIIMLGPMLVDPIVGFLLKHGWNGEMQDGVPFYSVSDYKMAFLIIPLLFIGSLFLSFLYKDKNEDECALMTDTVIKHSHA